MARANYDNGKRVLDFMARYIRVKEDVPFDILPWIENFVLDMFATRNGRLLYSRNLLSCGKKNGKTELAAALVLALLCGPTATLIPIGQRICSAAGSKEQAGEVYRKADWMIRRMPALAARLEVKASTKHIFHRERLSYYDALPANARTVQGIEPYFWIYDEYSQAIDNNLYDALDRGQGAVSDMSASGLIISTLSDRPGDPMNELIGGIADGKANGVMRHWNSVVYAADPERDRFDMENVARANPSLGHHLSAAAIATEVEEAKQLASRRQKYYSYRLNISSGTDTPLIDMTEWQACKGKFSRKTLEGLECVGGLDLSSSQDLTALALYFPSKHRLIAFAWLPEETLDEKADTDHAPYRTWQEQGWLLTTPGRVIEYDHIARAIEGFANEYKIRVVRYDRWNIRALQTLADIQKINLPPMEPCGQGFRDMSPAVDEFERLVLAGKLRHEDNPVLNMCIRNSALKQDAHATSDVRKPVKLRPEHRIDMAVATLMAVRPDEASLEVVPDGGIIASTGFYDDG